MWHIAGISTKNIPITFEMGVTELDDGRAPNNCIHFCGLIRDLINFVYQKNNGKCFDSHKRVKNNRTQILGKTDKKENLDKTLRISSAM